VHILATFLSLLLRVSQNHQQRDEDERVDEKLDDRVFENALSIRNFQRLILTLHAQLILHDFLPLKLTAVSIIEATILLALDD